MKDGGAEEDSVDNCNNLKSWFNNLKMVFLELSTAATDKACDIIKHQEQMKNIVNLDHTCLSLDGHYRQQGGYPDVLSYDLQFP